MERLMRSFSRLCHHTSYSYRSHTCGELTAAHIGNKVTLCGWMLKPRKLGGSLDVAFIPLCDASGKTQLVCQDKSILHAIEDLKAESVIKVMGMVSERPAGNVNKEMSTGSIEVQVNSLEILNKADELPFRPYSKSNPTISEELMLKERHLDIRRPVVQRVLRLRSHVSGIIRQYLNKNGFVEVETPTLFKPTPEGAKEFLVPTQDYGKFFSLTQSPQQFKQLLMVGGIDRYFQFARCYRDERSRSDRQPEFTQIDLEMSFITQESIMNMMEELITEVFTTALPHVTPPTRPFHVMSYRQAMQEYGSDKPDTRYDMKLQNVTNTWQECTGGSIPKGIEMVGFHIPQWQQMVNEFRPAKWKSVWRTLFDSPSHFTTVMWHCDTQLNVIVEADEPFNDGVKSSDLLSSCRNEISNVADHVSNRQHGVVLGVFREENRDEALQELGRLRSNIAAELCKSGMMTLPPEQFNCLWVTNFPLFSIETGNNGDQLVKSTHHPFTSPIEEDSRLLYSATTIKELTQITAQHYDLVVNGWELGGGSIRIHDADVQEHVFCNILKTGSEKFSHLLKGLRSGCPPHGGIALGFDRMIAIFCGASSVRDVIAFPKSVSGKDLMMGSPTVVSDKELLDYGIKLAKNI